MAAFTADTERRHCHPVYIVATPRAALPTFNVNRDQVSIAR